MSNFYLQSTIGTHPVADIIAPKYTWAHYIVIENPHLIGLPIEWVVPLIIDTIRNTYPGRRPSEWETRRM